MNRLYSKTRATSVLSVFRPQLDPVEPYGPNPEIALIDNVPVDESLNRLAVQSIVSAIGGLDNNTDKSNFRACVNPVRILTQFVAEKPKPYKLVRLLTLPLLQNDATSQTMQEMLQLTDLLFAEHVDWHLTSNKDANGASDALPSLAELASTAGFKEAFADKLADTKFIHGEIAVDLARGGEHIFSLALLFICQYVYHGPGFIPLTGTAFETAASRQVLQQWATELLNQPNPNAQQILATLVNVASLVVDTSGSSNSVPAILHPHASSAHGLAGIASASRVIFDHVLQPALANAHIPGLKSSFGKLGDLINDDIEEYMTIAANNQAQWFAMQDKWIRAVVAVATSTTQTTQSTFNDFGRGFIIGITLGLEDHQVRTPYDEVHLQLLTVAQRGI